MTPEGIIESYFKKQIKAYGALPIKFTSPTLLGVPDQIVISQGNTYFCEIKAPGKKPRRSQEKVHDMFNEYGVRVYVISTKDQVDSFIHDILKLNTKITDMQTSDKQASLFKN